MLHIKNIAKALIRKALPTPALRNLREVGLKFRYHQDSKEYSSILQRTFSADIRILRSSGKPFPFRVLQSFSHDEIRRGMANEIRDLLSREKIHFWSSHSYSSECSRIDIMSEDAEKLFRALAKSSKFAHWNYERLDNRRRRIGSVRSVAKIKYRPGMSGIRIYERVAFEGNLSFRTAAKQGVEINLWANTDVQDSDRKFIAAGVFEENGSILSHPLLASEDFRDELRLREKSTINRVIFPIDAVYTWVNGADKQWRRRKAEAAGNSAENSWVREATLDSRFRDHEELRYSLRSIDQYAPWIRTIYIVTDNQIPEWLIETHPRIKIIDHTEIWPGREGLPSFNSHAIETCLHRIPGLSDNYLYINDDVLLTRPIAPSLFFEPSGLSKVFWSRAQVNFSVVDSWDNASTVAAKNARNLMFEESGRVFSRKYFHTPGALNRRHMGELEQSYSEIFAETRANQFRSSSDIAASGSFYFNNAVLRGWGIPGLIRYDYIDPGSEDGRRRMERVIGTRNYDCIVVNDGASTSSEPSVNVDSFINESLLRLLPIAAPWERPE